MRITDIECTVLRLPEVQLIGDGLQDVLLVEVHTDEGVSGLGEAHTMPTALRAIVEAPPSQLAVRGLAELLLGEDPSDIDGLWTRMWTSAASVLGRRGLIMHAISAVDIALWDIAGKVRGVPVADLLGDARRDRVPVYASDLMLDDDERLIARARAHVAAGFTAVKFGWGGIGADVGADIERVARLRAALGDDVQLMLDVGVAIPFERAVALADGIAESSVYFLEEPLDADDLDGYRRLVDRSPVPIAAGERETGLSGFRQLIESGRVPIVQPDVARVGGLSEARRIAALAGAAGAEVIPHCWSTDILVAASLHLLATLPSAPFLEVNVTDNPLRSELTIPHLQQRAGSLQVPSGPGLGVTLNRDIVDRFRT